MIREGQRVVAREDPTRTGRVLVASSTAAHVKWDDGVTGVIASADMMTYASTVAGVLDESLDHGLPTVTGARETYEEDGLPGIVAMVEEHGLLDRGAQFAQEALDHVAGALRRDATLSAVLGALGEPEGDAVVAHLTTALIQEAMR